MVEPFRQKSLRKKRASRPLTPIIRSRRRLASSKAHSVCRSESRNRPPHKKPRRAPSPSRRISPDQAPRRHTECACYNRLPPCASGDYTAGSAIFTRAGSTTVTWETTFVASGKYLFTSEAVSMGHPDKLADQISDGVLDALFAQDPYSRVACETMVTTGMVVIAGEITTKAYVDMQKVVREVIRDVGYTDSPM